MKFTSILLVLLSCLSVAKAELVASYDFSEGSLADASGNGHTAAIVGSLTGVATNDVRGAVFDLTGGSGSENNPGSYLNLPLAGTGSGPWTLALWIQDGDSKMSYLFDNRDMGATGTDRLIFSTEHNVPGSKAGVFNGAAWAAGDTSIRDGLWHHVVWAYSNTTLTVYTDGAAVETTSFTAIDLLSDSVRLGNRSGDGAQGQAGRKVDDVYVYNHALNHSEVTALMEATKAQPVVYDVNITNMEHDATAATVDISWTSKGSVPSFEVLSSNDIAAPLTNWTVEAEMVANGGDVTSAQLTGITNTTHFFAVGEQRPVVSGDLALVPWPRSISIQEEQYLTLAPSARILYDTRTVARSIENSLQPLAAVLAGELELITGNLPDVLELSAGEEPQVGDIALRFDAITDDFAATEAEEDQSYTMSVSATGVVVNAQYVKGVAYGTATLLQALSEENTTFRLPIMEVDDAPTAAYRAVMLDVARQIHSIGTIKDTIRMARLYKMRYLHLHLTDDQNFTFPFTQITDQVTGNFTYTRADLLDLVAYADAHGVTLIPEMDLPGHSSILKDSGYLDPGDSDADVADPANYAKIQAIIDDMIGIFTNAPYFHIGGDESAAGETLIPFLEAMNNHLRGTPTGGKRRLLVWEGFNGAPTSQLPATGDDRIIVMAWESSYNAPWSLLAADYELINASWKPLYCVGGGSLIHPGNTGGKKFWPEEIHHWNKDTFMHWEPGRPVYEDQGPSDPDLTDHEWSATYIDRQDQIIGGQLLFWEQYEKTVINQLKNRIPAMAERLWNPALADDFSTFSQRASDGQERVLTIVQPVEILPPMPTPHAPIMDLYRPYVGDSLHVTLRNRTRIAGTMRWEKGGFSNNLTYFNFPDTPAPTTASSSYSVPFAESGGFSIRAKLFRADGTAVDGDTWQFFNNWSNRVNVTDYDIGEPDGSEVPDLAALTPADVVRAYDMPMLRGQLRNVEKVGQLQQAMLTPPGSGTYTVSLKTQSGHASLYLDLNGNGSWDTGEKLITDTPSDESVQSTTVTLAADTSYLLRVDHKTDMPRPVLVVYLEGPATNGRQEASPWLTLP